MNLRVLFANAGAPWYYSLTSWMPDARISNRGNLNEEGKVIVSLTTKPSRIHKTWLVIESILRQSEKPDALLLCLSEQEFTSKDMVPKEVLQQEKRGLQIVFTKENLKPHNKYMYAMENFPNASIVTIDDDKIYPKNLIANLKSYNKLYPGAICTTMARVIKFNNKEVEPYNNWNIYTKNSAPKHSLLSLGVSGVLFPPKSLHPDLFDKDTLREKSLLADDLWLKVMALKNNTPVASLAENFDKPFLSITGIHIEQLRHHNVTQGGNDTVFKDLLEHFQIGEEAFAD